MVRVTGVSFTLADGVSVETITTQNASQITAMNLTGNGFNNAIYGTAGANVLRGRGGNDRLFGFEGNDTLRGGFGTDQLTGGAGNDLFVIGDAPESTVAAPDRILDFASGDDIHLSEIDANSNVGGNQAFTFIGASRLHQHRRRAALPAGRRQHLRLRRHQRRRRCRFRHPARRTACADRQLVRPLGARVPHRLFTYGGRRRRTVWLTSAFHPRLGPA